MRGKDVAPIIRNPAPVSKSAVLRSGNAEMAWSRLRSDAASSGRPSVTAPYVGLSSTAGAGSDPPKTWNPPMCNSWIVLASSSKVFESVLV
jgi:hypothetical protein